MDFREAKKLIAYAKKNGIKSLKCGDVEVTFGDTSVRMAVQEVDVPKAIHSMVMPPTLDQVNDYIYGNPDEIENA